MMRLSAVSSSASELAPSAGLRNRLVHRYDDLDDELVFRGVATFVQRFPEYVRGIDAWLKTEAESGQ
jgi:uncharacterized protein YutE (UPF0331/DUF86 family)